MRKFVIICVSMFCIIGAQAQNWDINTLQYGWEVCAKL